MIRIDPSLKITRGYLRALLFHPVRKNVHLIPDTFASILTRYSFFDMPQLMQEFGSASEDVLHEYHLFLLDNGYLLDDHIPFAAVTEEWDLPHHIVTAIVEITAGNFDIVRLAIMQLGELGCHTLELRAMLPVSPAELLRILSLIDCTRIRSVLVILPFDPLYTTECIAQIIHGHLRITALVFTASPEEKSETFFSGATTVLFSGKSFDPLLSCGVIRIDNFDFGKYKEAKDHNSCLNRKISVSSDGTIRNCPSLAVSYGNIRSIALKEVLPDENFLFYWGITKDQVKKCCDCEFRFFCYDCRAFLEDPGDLYSKPLKCGYDPYTASWEPWNNSIARQRIFAEYERLTHSEGIRNL